MSVDAVQRHSRCGEDQVHAAPALPPPLLLLPLPSPPRTAFRQPPWIGAPSPPVVPQANPAPVAAALASASPPRPPHRFHGRAPDVDGKFCRQMAGVVGDAEWKARGHNKVRGCRAEGEETGERRRSKPAALAPGSDAQAARRPGFARVGWRAPALFPSARHGLLTFVPRHDRHERLAELAVLAERCGRGPTERAGG